VRGPAGRVGASVSQPRRDDPAVALNQVLSEVIDGVLDVRQAARRVPETHALHTVLDQLFDDLRTWAQLLADQDQALGVSPLASMPTGTSRTPPHSWHGAASDEEVRRIVGEDLDRLGGCIPSSPVKAIACTGPGGVSTQNPRYGASPRPSCSPAGPPMPPTGRSIPPPAGSWAEKFAASAPRLTAAPRREAGSAR
jgi:hypothetical protein